MVNTAPTKSKQRRNTTVTVPDKVKVKSKASAKEAQDKDSAKSNPIRNYKAALSFLFSNTNYESAKRLRYNEDTFNLDRMYKLLQGLGNPHAKLAAVHIAGTKGKGSTCTMLMEMLKACGYKTGLYTSPHVLDLRERIQINGNLISEAAMVRLVRKAAPVVAKMAGDPPTFFEILTAMAFLHFKTENVDICVIETGLGGRLDSTNVLMPQAVGITSISLDHQQQLGNSIAQIAKEKAGIFKKDVPSVSVPQDPEAAKVLKREASLAGSNLRFTGKDIDFSYRFESSRSMGPHNRICLTTSTSKFEHLPVPLYGEHQAINCGLALSLLDCLKGQGFEIDDAKAVAGLAKTRLQGRMEMVCADPRVMIDGAHNAASIRALIQATGQHIPYDSMVVIFGCCEDKDVQGMLRELQYGADKVIFTRINSPRSMLPEELAQQYTEICGKMCQSAYSLAEAIRIAKPALTNGDLLLITGSFYLVGQAKQFFAEGQPRV